MPGDDAGARRARRRRRRVRPAASSSRSARAAGRPGRRRCRCCRRRAGRSPSALARQRVEDVAEQRRDARGRASAAPPRAPRRCRARGGPRRASACGHPARPAADVEGRALAVRQHRPVDRVGVAQPGLRSAAARRRPSASEHAGTGDPRRAAAKTPAQRDVRHDGHRGHRLPGAARTGRRSSVVGHRVGVRDGVDVAQLARRRRTVWPAAASASRVRGDVSGRDIGTPARPRGRSRVAAGPSTHQPPSGAGPEHRVPVAAAPRRPRGGRPR